MVPAGTGLRTETSTLLVLSSISIELLTVILEGKGPEISPPLPIIYKPFGFLKSINLSSVGLGLNEIPFKFGWDLVVWKPVVVQSEPNGVLGPSEAHVEVVDALDDSSPFEGDSDSVMVATRAEPVSEQGEFRTGPEPVPETGEVEPPLVFEEDVDESFDKVADFEKDKEVEIPILAVQSTTLKVPQTSEGQKKKQIKTLVGRTDLLLVRQFKAMQAKASFSPSQPKSAKPKPAPKPSRKSFRLASQSFSRTVKKTDSSKQSPLWLRRLLPHQRVRLLETLETPLANRALLIPQ